MGNEVSSKDAFDSRFLPEFEIGDLVSWSNLGAQREYGYIFQIYSQDLTADRKFTFAKVRKTNGTVENFMLSSLTKES